MEECAEAFPELEVEYFMRENSSEARRVDEAVEKYSTPLRYQLKGISTAVPESQEMIDSLLKDR
jgi:hypothetical protein